MSAYTSSIINKYGDSERVRQDVVTLNEILSRQGSALFIDVLAESVGNTVLKFKLSRDEVIRIRESMSLELCEAIGERT